MSAAEPPSHSEVVETLVKSARPGQPQVNNNQKPVPKGPSGERATTPGVTNTGRGRSSSSKSTKSSNEGRGQHPAQKRQFKRNKGKATDSLMEAIEEQTDAANEEAEKLEQEQRDKDKLEELLFHYARIVGGVYSDSTYLANSTDLYLFEDHLDLFKKLDRPKYRSLAVAFAVAKASLRLDRAHQPYRDGTSQQLLHSLLASAFRDLRVGDADAMLCIEEARAVYRAGYRTLADAAIPERFDQYGAVPEPPVEVKVPLTWKEKIEGYLGPVDRVLTTSALLANVITGGFAAYKILVGKGKGLGPAPVPKHH